MQVGNPARRNTDVQGTTPDFGKETACGAFLSAHGHTILPYARFSDELDAPKGKPRTRSRCPVPANESHGKLSNPDLINPPEGAVEEAEGQNENCREPLHGVEFFGILVAMSRLAAFVTLAGCGAETEFHRFAGRTMGTEYVVTVSGGSDCNGALQGLVENELRSVNAQMSTWQPDSELSRFNRARAGGWVPVSADLAGVVAVAQDLASQSDGAFDVTVGPLVDLWGFGARARRGMPGPDEIAETATRVGYRFLEARLSPPGLRKLADGLRVDLSAIAKGHGVDRLAALLDGRGCTDYLIDIGGDLRVRGLNPRGLPWRIGVETPVPAGGEQAGVYLSLSAGAVATSGDYRNFRRIGAFRFSHVIDPRTGRPLGHDMASVTVLADTAALADGLATLINVLGPEDGLAFADRRGIAALVIVRRRGGLDRRYTESMRHRLGYPP